MSRRRWLLAGVTASVLLAGPAPAYYGDVTMQRTTPRYGMPPVVFPHWVHRAQFTCRTCHPALFLMKADAHEIMMERMVGRRTYCAACHDGRVAWAPVNCVRCHVVGEPRPGPGTLPAPGPPFARDNADAAAALRAFPRDAGGTVDWVAALAAGLIAPRPSISGAPVAVVPAPPDSVMRRTGAEPPVRFPHSVHARWLDCGSCHPAPFAARNGANEITMAKIYAGEACGRCHGKVAFPATECARCHRPGPERKG